MTITQLRVCSEAACTHQGLLNLNIQGASISWWSLTLFLNSVEIAVDRLVTENHLVSADKSFIAPSERLQMFTIMTLNFKDRSYSNKVQELVNEVTWTEKHEDLACNKE